MNVQSKDYNRLAIIPEPEWEELGKNLLQHTGPTVLIGATNSGKSTLTQYLLRRFIENHTTIALVDTDIGQSSLGMPGTITMKVFKNLRDIEVFHAEKTFFIGSLNPAQKIPLIIAGTKNLVQKAQKKSDHILVDTTGLIHGETGVALKIGKIKSIKSGQIITLERNNELEQILSMVHDITVYRLKASRSVRDRSRDMRIRYRQKKFNEYFHERRIHELFLDDVAFYYNGKPLSPKSTDFKEGSVIGLNKNEDTKALGILLELDNCSVTFKSPIESLRGINRIVFGDITINN
jgi:polynucleotide 5'-hydroxyl-kinase GRC3/NOL9